MDSKDSDTSTEDLQKSEMENMETDEEESFLDKTDLKQIDSSITKNVINNELMTSEDVIQNCEWEVNDLAWARMSIYPFWPCMVTHDPSALMTFKKVQSVGKSKTLMVHVHFFNDNGRHCWVPAHHMIPFVGIEDFHKRATLVTDVIRKKEPKFAAALTIKPSTFSTWQKAVAEAMDVLYDLDYSSLDNFKVKPKETTNVNLTKSNNVVRKRKRKDDENNLKKQVLKPVDSNNELQENTSTSIDNTDIEKLNLETPPVSPPNEEDVRAATYQKQKRITKMINKLQPPDFEVYFERNFFIIKEQHPEATDDQVREYLQDIWEGMAPEEKQKYRATYKIESDS